MYGTLRDKFSPIRVAAFESLIVEYSIHIISIQLVYPLRGIVFGSTAKYFWKKESTYLILELISWIAASYFYVSFPGL